MEDVENRELVVWQNNASLDLSLISFKTRLTLHQTLTEAGVAFDRITPALVTANITKAITKSKTH